MKIVLPILNPIAFMEQLIIGIAIDKYLVGEYNMIQVFDELRYFKWSDTKIIILLEAISPSLAITYN